MDNQFDQDAFNPFDLEMDPNALHKLGNQIRETIFKMIALVTREPEISVYVALIIPFIELIQVISFAFYDQDYQIWTLPAVQNGLHDFFEYLRFSTYFENTSFGVYTAIFFVIAFILIVFVLCGFAYGYYMASRNRPVFNWLIQSMRTLLLLSSSILFYPVVDYFVSILHCTKNASGVQVHKYFSGTECWTGLHLVISIFAVIATITFLFLSFIAVLTLYEARPLNNNFNSKMNTRSLLTFNLHKFILVVLFTVFNSDNYQILLIIYVLFGSTVIFVLFQFFNPFYKDLIAKAWSTIAAANLWTAFCIVFAKVMEITTFDETVFIWLIGLPLVLIVNIYNESKRMNYLYINPSKFESGEEIIFHIDCLQRLLNLQNSDKTSAALLDGYLATHRNVCYNDQCPCKNQSKILSNNTVTRNLLNRNENISEKEVIIIYLIYRLYSQGIKTFPSYIPLRIGYSFFLLDKLSSRQQALQVLTDAEQRSPPIDQAFILFKYKKVIEDEIAEAQSEKKAEAHIELEGESSFMHNYRLCQAFIEKCCLLHMEFWSQIQEDQPDLARINDLGLKISQGIKVTDDQWNKLVKTNPNNAKAYRLYGKYLVEILHNREKGEELLAKASKLNEMMNAGGGNFNFAERDLSDESVPTIIISGEQQRFGLINSINAAAASLFGYTKTELLNKSLNYLMPAIYANQHDNLIERFIHSNESTIQTKKKDRFVFGRNKASYIFPFYYNVKLVPSTSQGVQFIATLRIEKKFRNAAYMLTTPSGEIEGISSSCISLLRLDKPNLQNKGNIQDFIPNIMVDRYALFANKKPGPKGNSVPITFHFPEQIEDQPSQEKFLCSMDDIIVKGNNDSLGFQWKFEKESARNTAPLELVNKTTNFQFRYDLNTSVYVGEYTNDTNLAPVTEILSPKSHDPLSPKGFDEQQTELLSNQNRNRSSMSKRTGSQEYAAQRFTDFGIGINPFPYGTLSLERVKTYQLIQRGVHEIEDKSENNEDESEDERSTPNTAKKGVAFADGVEIEVPEAQNQNGFEEDEENPADFNRILKSRKFINNIANDKSSDRNIKRLNWIVFILGLILIAFSIWDYVKFINSVKKLSENIDAINNANRMNAYMMTALSNIRDLYLFKLGLLTTTTTLTEAALRANILSALYTASDIKATLEQSSNTMSQAHLDLYMEPSITLKAYSGATTLKGLSQATEDIVTVGLELATNTDLADISPTNADYYFVTYNLMNDYYVALKKSSQMYVEEFIDQTDAGQFSIILLLFTLACVVGYIISVPILFSIMRSQSEILKLFLEIPDKMIKALYSECENFVSNLQIGEEEQIGSELDVDETRGDEENEPHGFLSRKKKKKFKDSRNTHKYFLVGFAFALVILIIPLIISYATTNKTVTDVSVIAVEFNQTSLAESFFGFVRNAQNQLYIDKTQTILGKAPLTIAIDNINHMRDLTSSILSNNSINTDSHSTSYNNLFSDIFYNNPCPYITWAVAESSCKTFANKTVPNGMSLLLIRHLENMNLLLTTYESLIVGGAWTFDASLVVSVSSSTITNRVMSLIRTPRGVEISPTQDIYIFSTFRLLNYRFIESINDGFDNAKVVKLLGFLIFLVLLFVFFILIWVPYITKLNTMISKTRSMLTMIPVQAIAKIRNIRAYLRTVMSESQFAHY